MDLVSRERLQEERRWLLGAVQEVERVLFL